MRIFGRSSVSSVMNTLLKTAWLVSWIVVILVILVGVIQMFSPDLVNEYYTYVHVGVNKTLFFFTGSSPEPAASDTRLVIAPGYIRLLRMDTDFVRLSLVFTLLFWVMGMVIIQNLRRFFTTLTFQGSPFVMENVRYLKVVGYTIMASAPIRGIYEWLFGNYLMRNIRLEGAVFKSIFSLEISSVFLGLIVIVMAEILRRGIELQNEQNLTV